MDRNIKIYIHFLKFIYLNENKIKKKKSCFFIMVLFRIYLIGNDIYLFKGDAWLFLMVENIFLNFQNINFF